MSKPIVLYSLANSIERGNPTYPSPTTAIFMICFHKDDRSLFFFWKNDTINAIMKKKSLYKNRLKEISLVFLNTYQNILGK